MTHRDPDQRERADDFDFVVALRGRPAVAAFLRRFGAAGLRHFLNMVPRHVGAPQRHA